MELFHPAGFDKWTLPTIHKGESHTHHRIFLSGAKVRRSQPATAPETNGMGLALP
jgi:hypothetical protein